MILEPQIIVDFDGVLRDSRAWNRTAIEQFNRVIHKTRADIVISSSWRESHSPADLRQLFIELGIHGRIVNVTPVLDERLFVSSLDQRYHEIQAYLNKITPMHLPFVVVDDCPFKLSAFGHRYVTTEYEKGITEENANVLIEWLSNLHGLPHYEAITAYPPQPEL